VIVSQCSGTPPFDSGGTGIDDGLLGTPPGTLPVPLAPGRAPAEMLTSGYLERLGFHYRPPKPSTIYRHPSKLGMRA
jgi:hypothetical protein